MTDNFVEDFDAGEPSSWNVTMDTDNTELSTVTMPPDYFDDHSNCSFDISVCGNLTDEYKEVTLMNENVVSPGNSFGVT